MGMGRWTGYGVFFVVVVVPEQGMLRPYSLTNMFHRVRSLFSFSYSFHFLSVTAI